MNIKEKIIRKLETEITTLQERVNKLKAVEIQDIDIGIEPTFCNDIIDFDHLPHKEVIKVVQAIGGSWDKEVASSGQRINYSTTKGGIRFRCYEGEPPPNCRIVEVLEEVPAVPATVKTVRRLQCV